MIKTIIMSIMSIIMIGFVFNNYVVTYEKESIFYKDNMRFFANLVLVLSITMSVTNIVMFVIFFYIF